MTGPVCKRCGSERTSRKERQGFFQKTIMFSLGFFPWECNSCWKTFWSTERGQRRSSRRSQRTKNPDPLQTQ